MALLEYLLVFSNVLNTSVAAGWVILGVMLLRLLLRRTPKWVNVALWGIVALRLLMPFSIESVFSLIPSARVVSGELLLAGPVDGAAPAYLQIVTNPSFGAPVSVALDSSISSFQWDLVELNLLWWAGMALMGLYMAGSYLSLRRRLGTAVRLRGNIYQCEGVHSPFVLGFLRPRIYLPYGMDDPHVLAHEEAHIRRKDHWWKPLGFLLLTVHWFNPLMWLAYVLLCRDIELACDEKVISGLDHAQRADYTQALVSCSIRRPSIAACPLAFGEVGVKKRVRNVMNYKKPAFWVIVAAVVTCIAVAVCFLTDPKPMPKYTLSGDIHTIILSHESSNGETAVATVTDKRVISELLMALESVQVEDYSRPLCPERMVLTFLNDSEEQQNWTVSYYEADGEIVTCGSAFGIGNKRVSSDFDYHWLLELFDGARVSMIPTDTKLSGFGSGALLLPLDGQTYRYLLTDSTPEGVTADELLFSFRETDMGESVLNEVYSLKEYTDRRCVLLVSAKNGPWLCEYSPPQRCPDAALNDAIEAGAVVLEDGSATHGQALWYEFYEKTRQGQEASVTVAHYHTLDPDSCDSVYYQIFRQDYPCLYTYELRYDGDQFTLTGGAEEPRTYKYLMKYEDGPRYTFSSILPQVRDVYVLTQESGYTYDELWMSVASSQLGAYIDHYTIYSEPNQ